jgi:hypothetical protein
MKRQRKIREKERSGIDGDGTDKQRGKRMKASDTEKEVVEAK